MILIVTIKNIYNNPEINHVNDIIQKTRFDHEHKYGCCGDRINIKSNVNFSDKKNKTKNITVKGCKSGIKKNNYSISKKI